MGGATPLDRHLDQDAAPVHDGARAYPFQRGDGHGTAPEREARAWASTERIKRKLQALTGERMAIWPQHMARPPTNAKPPDASPQTGRTAD